MRKWPGWVLLLAVAGATAVAVALLFWSWRSQTSTWESGLLVQFGSTLLLFVPLAIVGRIIERRLDAVGLRQEEITKRQEVTASEVAQLADDVAKTREDLRLTREELSRTVLQRIAATRDEDAARFQEVGDIPSREIVLTSLNRAQALNLISNEGCRIDLFGTGIYLRFKPEFKHYDDALSGDRDSDTIELILEYADADEIDRISWGDEQAVSDIALGVAQMMQSSDTYPGDSSFDAGKIFEDLSALLRMIHDKVTRTGGLVFSMNRIIQLCPPQWAIGDRGIYCVERHYPIEANRLEEIDWGSQMRGKPWVDVDSFDDALSIGLALYKAGKLAMKPPGYKPAFPA